MADLLVAQKVTKRFGGLIAVNNAHGIDPRRFTAMTRLDHNRAKAQLAARAGVHVTEVTKMTIWGNHSATQYPDVFHAAVGGRSGFEAAGSDQAWLEKEFIPSVQQRGAAIIEARGSSSAASAAAIRSKSVDYHAAQQFPPPEADHRLIRPVRPTT